MRRIALTLLPTLALALAAGCARRTAGPFVREIYLERGNLVLVKCTVEIAGERLAEGPCRRESRPLPITVEDRVPEDRPCGEPPPGNRPDAAPLPPPGR